MWPSGYRPPARARPAQGIAGRVAMLRSDATCPAPPGSEAPLTAAELLDRLALSPDPLVAAWASHLLSTRVPDQAEPTPAPPASAGTKPRSWRPRKPR